MASTQSDHPHSGMPELVPTGEGHHRCAECERIFYSDPKLAVAAIIPLDGGIVLIKRGIEPAYGKWSFPSGYVNRGEVVEKALVREVREETELTVRTSQLIGLYSKPGQAVVLAVYEAEVLGGKLAAADEVLEARIFSPAQLPELAFEHDVQIIDEWRQGRAER